MMRIATATFIFGGVYLSSCATRGETLAEAKPLASALTTQSELPAQTLAVGECGLFGWTTDQPSKFVFFSTDTRALYLVNPDEVEALSPIGDFPASDYGRMTLNLGEGDPFVEGVRYPSARITETLDNGFTRVRPIVVLESCQTRTR